MDRYITSLMFVFFFLFFSASYPHMSPHMTPIEPAMPHQMSGTFYQTTSSGYPYTYHNGVAYFNCANMNPPPYHWSVSMLLFCSQLTRLTF